MEPPAAPGGSTWYADPLNLKDLDKTLVWRLADQGIPASVELCMFFALHNRDMKILRRAAVVASESSRDSHAFASVLPYALQAGWVEGARVLANARHLSLPSSYHMIRNAVKSPSPSGLACFKRACVEVLPDWKAAAFWVAFLEGHVSVLQHVVQRGALGAPGSPLPWIPFGQAGRSVSRFSNFRSEWAAEMAQSSTLGGLLPANVAVLINAALRRVPQSEIRRWREPARLLQLWWSRQSRAYAHRRGTSAAPYLPHVPLMIMQHAGIATPEEFNVATAITARICHWWQVPFIIRDRGTTCQITTCTSCGQRTGTAWSAADCGVGSTLANFKVLSVHLCSCFLEKKVSEASAVGICLLAL